MANNTNTKKISGLNTINQVNLVIDLENDERLRTCILGFKDLRMVTLPQLGTKVLTVVVLEYKLNNNLYMVTLKNACFFL